MVSIFPSVGIVGIYHGMCIAKKLVFFSIFLIDLSQLNLLHRIPISLHRYMLNDEEGHILHVH